MKLHKPLRKRQVIILYWQSSKNSFRKIQIFKFAYLHFRRFAHCLGSKSLLHRAVYTKSVRESEEIGCISLQSSRSSFRKIQMFKFAYLHFRYFIHCLGSKSLLHRAVHTRSLKESQEITFIYSQSSKISFCKIITDFRNLQVKVEM